MNSLSLKALVCVMLVYKSVAAVPVLSPCTDPCGGSNSVSGTQGHGQRSSLNFTQALQNALVSARDVKSLADRLVRSYISSTQGRVSDNTVNVIAAVHLVPHNRRDSTNVTATLQNDFNDVSIISVFVNTIHQNERDSDRKVNYSHLMDDLEGSLEATLCKIKVAARARGDNLVCIVTYNAMPVRYRNIPNIVNRYNRDYIVFRDTASFFTSLLDSYTSSSLVMGNSNEDV